MTTPRRRRSAKGALTPPFPARFWGDEFRARLEALMVTSAKATPCTVCDHLMVARAGSAHVACETGEVPSGSTRFSTEEVVMGHAAPAPRTQRRASP